MRRYFYLIAVLMFAGCAHNEITISLVNSESWIDLMPGTPGNTYLQMQFNVEGKNASETAVSGVKIRMGESSYNLMENEFEYVVTPKDSDLAVLNLRAVLQLKKDEVTELDAEIEFNTSNGTNVQNFGQIKVEKVY
jgi:hypothetical protein